MEDASRVSAPDATLRTWEEFLSDALKNAHFLAKDAVFSNGFSCSPTAVTAINGALIDLAIANGAPGLIISVNDYQKEALAYCLNWAVGKAIDAGTQRIDVLPHNVKQDDLLCADNAIIRFIEKTFDDEFGDRVSYVYNSVKSSMPLSKMPILHPCKANSKPQIRPKERSFSTVASRLSGYGDIERALMNGCSTISSAIGLAIPSSRVPNATPTQLHKGTLHIGETEHPIDSILPTAHFRHDRDLVIDYSHPAQATPAVVLTSREESYGGRGDLYNFLSYLDAGKPLSAIVIELDSAFAIDDGYINDIKDISAGYHVPVILFCDQVTARDLSREVDLGFPIFRWNIPELQALRNVANSFDGGLDLSPQQTNYLLTREIILAAEPPAGSSEAASALFNLADNSPELPEREEIALSSLLRLFGQMLRRTCICGKTIAQITQNQLGEIEDTLCGNKSSKTLPPSEADKIRSVCALLRAQTARGTSPSKQEMVWERIKSVSNEETIYLVVANASSRDEERRYWNYALERTGRPVEHLAILSLREFLRTDLSNCNPCVILSGWLSRDEIDRALRSGNASLYYSLLYTGHNLEMEWRRKAHETWERNDREAGTANVKMLQSFGVNGVTETFASRRVPDQSTPSLCENPVLENISDAIRAVTERANRCEASARVGEAVLARPVHFTNGETCWLECSPDRRTRLITVTDCLSDDCAPLRKQADLIEPGDVVLRIDNDDDLVSSAEAHSQSYNDLLSIARLWHKPIENAHGRVMPRQAIHLIQKHGCTRGKQTIRRWISDDTVIAPQDDNDIRIIGEAFGEPFSDEDIARMRVAESRCVGSRIHKGREVTNSTVQLFVDDAREAHSFETAASSFAQKHPGQGQLDLYHVDWVGDARLTTRRLGWHTN